MSLVKINNTKSGITTLESVSDMLDFIRKQKNLRLFQFEKSTSFCQQHNIRPMQLNFLIAVVAAERVKEHATI